MLPLRSTQGVLRFPWGTLVLVGLFALVEIVLWAMPGTRHEALIALVQSPAAFHTDLLGHWAALALSFLVFGNLFSLWITCLYVWSFLPALVERDSMLWAVVASVGVSLGAFFLYRAYHGPNAAAPVLMAQVWVSALLGLAMRHEIWDTMTTFVLGFRIFRVFEVPSYVLLFFWFFYIMIGNLFLDAPLSDAPTSYFLPLTAFLVGFVIASLKIFASSRFGKVSPQ